MPITRCLLITATILAALLLAHTIRRAWPSLSPQDATERPVDSPIVSNATAQWMLVKARTEFEHGAGAIAEQAFDAPAEATRPQAHTVFISIYADSGPEQKEDQTSNRQATKPRSTFVGRGSNLASALNDAESKVLGGRGQAGPRLDTVAPRASRIKIDILTGGFDKLEKPSDSAMTASELVDIGSQGIEAVAGASSQYLLPAELIYSRAAESSESETAEELLDHAMIYLGFEANRWRAPGVTLRTFRTISFIENTPHTKALTVVRGFVPVGAEDGKTLLAAARNAGDYLVRMQKADGSFYYWYRALTDQADLNHYNIVRHAGTAVSLFDLYHATGDARYLAAASKSMAFLRSRFRHFDMTRAGGLDHIESNDGGLSRSTGAGSHSPSLCVLDDDNKAKLGAGGLALLAVTREMELDHKSASTEANELASGILAMQRPDGSFETDVKQDGEQSDSQPSLYYPGEAILGLVRLYRINNDRRLLDGVRRGANYLVSVQRRQRDLPPDAWLVQALESVFEATKDPRYAEHAVDLASAMADSFYPADGPAGYEGAVAPGIPRVTPAASRSEGILSGYRIARATRDSRADRLLTAARNAARFQLSQQFGTDNSFFLPNPGRAAGGFHESLDSMRIRIDYVQHNISSLLSLAEVRDP